MVLYRKKRRNTISNKKTSDTFRHHLLKILYLLFFCPRGGSERQKKRIKLQSAEKHRRGENQLREVRISREGRHGTDSGKSGTDVVVASRDRRDIRLKIERFKAEQEQKQCEHDEIHCEIRENSMLGFTVDCFALEFQGRHGARVQYPSQLTSG